MSKSVNMDAAMLRKIKDELLMKNIQYDDVMKVMDTLIDIYGKE